MESYSFTNKIRNFLVITDYHMWSINISQKNILQRGGRTNSLNISWAGLRRVFTLKESWFGGRLTCSLLAQPRLCKKYDFHLYFHCYVHFSILTPAALEPI